jgi:D-alanine-D-alanine ligase
VKVLVIGGGISPERDVSLRSSQSVHEALLKAGYESFLYDWDGTGEWLGINARQYDVAFPVLHGTGGEDGQIQKILENINITYVGTDSINSANCIEKNTTREILASRGILVPIGAQVTYQQYRNHELFSRPHVLKPSLGGSSIDTFIFKDVLSRDLNAIELAFEKYETLLLEEYISGTEITVPILEGYTLPAIEIIPPPNKTFDYENKYNGATKELCPPEHVPVDVQKRAQKLALNVHEIMGCRHLSRTDFIIHGDKLYVLEVNTMPGFTDQSLFPRSAKVAGLEMQDLVAYIIKIARQDAHVS